MLSLLVKQIWKLNAPILYTSIARGHTKAYDSRMGKARVLQ